MCFSLLVFLALFSVLSFYVKNLISLQSYNFFFKKANFSL